MGIRQIFFHSVQVLNWFRYNGPNVRYLSMFLFLFVLITGGLALYCDQTVSLGLFGQWLKAFVQFFHYGSKKMTSTYDTSHRDEETPRVPAYDAGHHDKEIYLNIASFILWLLCCILGYMYVVSEYWYDDEHPRGRVGYNMKDHYIDFIKLIVLAIMFYMIGPHVTLYHSEVSKSTSMNNLKWNNLKWFGYNYGFFVLPFVVGLHFSYLQNIDKLNNTFFSLTASVIRRWTLEHLPIILSVIMIVLPPTIFHLYLMVVYRRLLLYGFYLGSVLILCILTYLMINYNPVMVWSSLWNVNHHHRLRYVLHLHHYFLFGILLPLLAYFNPVSTITHALCAGIAVEGIASWGAAPIFVPDIKPTIDAAVNGSINSSILL
jgi:hypothetical protein